MPHMLRHPMEIPPEQTLASERRRDTDQIVGQASVCAGRLLWVPAIVETVNDASLRPQVTPNFPKYALLKSNLR
jgi:hypothetical protein